VSLPLADLAAVAGRADLEPEDLAPATGRDDEIGALARTLTLALLRLEERRAQVAERTARLESALNAGTDGSPWRRCATELAHRPRQRDPREPRRTPADWFTGRTVHEGMAAIEPRLVEVEGVGQWVEQGLADPEFTGMRMSPMRDPDL
jgi:hypothetical protein